VDKVRGDKVRGDKARGDKARGEKKMSVDFGLWHLDFGIWYLDIWPLVFSISCIFQKIIPIFRPLKTGFSF
jgi:hypothetical protein